MKIWMLQTGEPLVVHPDSASAKPMRTGQFAIHLARRGHEVVWWASSFQHHTKQFLQPADRLMPTLEPNISLYMLSSPGYVNNVSYQRFRDHAILSRRWRRAAEEAERPDIIVTSWPLVDLSYQAVQYGIAHDVPVLIDVRDLWPDVIYNRLKTKLRLPWLPRFLFRYEYMTRKAFQGATGIMGITEAFVDWGLEKARRKRGPFDKAFHLSSPPLVSLSAKEEQEARAFWQQFGVDWAAERRVVFVWVGTLADDVVKRATLDTLAALPKEIAQKMRFVICGTGALQQLAGELASRHEHIIYAGYVDRAPLTWLLRHADYGMIPYERSFDFLRSLPNKVNEYLGAGLHIVTTLTGEVERLLGDRGVVHFSEPDEASIAKIFKSLVFKGKLKNYERQLAQQCYEDLFDNNMIYAIMCTHIEYVFGQH